MESFDLQQWTRIGAMNRNAGFSWQRAEECRLLPTEVGAPRRRFMERIDRLDIAQAGINGRSN